MNGSARILPAFIRGNGLMQAEGDSPERVWKHHSGMRIIPILAAPREFYQAGLVSVVRGKF